MGGCTPSKNATESATKPAAKAVAAPSNLPQDEVIEKILKIRASNPGNLMAKMFDPDYYNGLGEEDKKALIQCCRSGIENADSGMGCCTWRRAGDDVVP